jgi:hypothetical protein
LLGGEVLQGLVESDGGGLTEINQVITALAQRIEG